MNLFGLNFCVDGIHFNPIGSKLTDNMELGNIKYRDALLNIKIEGNGTEIKSFSINGLETQPFVSKESTGELNIKILLG